MEIKEVVHAFETVRKMIEEAPTKIIELRKQQSEAAKAEQDILHTMEFGKLSITEMGQLGFELQEVRLRIRKIKDDQYITQRICWFIDEHETITDATLQTLVEELKRIGEARSKRKYTMRIRKDLQSKIVN